MKKYELGKQYHGFECYGNRDVSEYQTTVYQFKHLKTGADVTSFDTLDENKTFAAIFNTPVSNSYGIPHILEHSVLCGSKKFPVKEPFTEMLKSSLHTFLNALTYPDRTCYPVASCNEKDFRNLVHVYLDAVFFPRAVHDENVFRQEGWHYELDSPEGDLSFKGVVFNEMKGVYTNTDSRMFYQLMEHLTPDVQYRHVSGGDPVVIPDLTFQEFKKYHETYYHPSNCRLLFYGNDDLDGRLIQLREYLDQFERAKFVYHETECQKLFDSPKVVRMEYPLGKEESLDKKTIFTSNWIISKDRLKERDIFIADVVNHLLRGTSTSRLRQALVESHLGTSLWGGDIDHTLRQTIFSIGLTDVLEADGEKVQNLIDTTLADIVENGFPQDAIEAAVNTLEFRLRELNCGSIPKGLEICFSAAQASLYGSDPVECLRFQNLLDEVKTDVLSENSKTLQNFIKERLVDNTHRVNLYFVPSHELFEKEVDQEKTKLREFRETLSADEIQKICEDTKKLKEIQNAHDSPEDLAKLPYLSITDLDPQQTRTEFVLNQDLASAVQLQDLNTSGIVYFDFAFDFSNVGLEHLAYLRVLTKLQKESGTEKRSAESLQRQMGIHSGGVTFSFSVQTEVDSGKVIPRLLVACKCVPGKVEKTLELIHEMLFDCKIEKSKALEVVREMRKDVERKIKTSGHRMVSFRISQSLSQSGLVNERLNGISFYESLREMEKEVESDFSGFLEKLNRVKKTVFARDSKKDYSSRFLINVTSDSSSHQTCIEQLPRFIDRVPLDNDFRRVELNPKREKDTGFSIVSQVNYVGKGAQLDYKQHAAALVAKKILYTSFLWDRVRVVGGAYGGMASYNEDTRVFIFSSYRDPNCSKTLDIYGEAGNYLANLEMSKEELERMIIGTIGDVDQYKLPDARGQTEFLNQISKHDYETRQRRKTEVLNTTLEDIREFGKSLERGINEGLISILGNRDHFKNLELEITTPLRD